MILGLKNITSSHNEFEECHAFTASICLDGEVVGVVEGDMNSRQFNVSVDETSSLVIKDNALNWLDQLDPAPIDESHPWPLQGDDFKRTAPSARADATVDEYFEMCIVGMYTNAQVLKEIKSIKSKASYATKTGRYLSYRFLDIAPECLDAGQKSEVEAEEGFCQWLYNLSDEAVAVRLGYRNIGDGPLLTQVGSQE